jgi:hypothetical protein
MWQLWTDYQAKLSDAIGHAVNFGLNVPSRNSVHQKCFAEFLCTFNQVECIHKKWGQR